MRLRLFRAGPGRFAATAAAVLVAAALFVWVAPYNIAARVPHLPGVAWLLNTYMENAVRTWSRGVERPGWVDLDDPALVRLGAAHFETGCAPCHGAPGRAPNPITRGMRPAPPDLRGAAAGYEADELHWIVRNGLKYTGMPAWAGDGRDDEPWALAAFLQRYPRLDPASYRDLAFGDAVPAGQPGAQLAFGRLDGGPEDPAANCARCHGRDGLGRDGTAPRIAGQSRAYLEATLAAFASGRRSSGIMGPVAAELSARQIERLAAHYAQLPAFEGQPAGGARPALVRAGAALAERGSAETPSCLSCHGQERTPPRNPLYPRISGQDERFLRIWLGLWQRGRFGGTDHAHVMHEAARWLSEDEIAALAAHFAGRRSDPGRAAAP